MPSGQGRRSTQYGQRRASRRHREYERYESMEEVKYRLDRKKMEENDAKERKQRRREEEQREEEEKILYGLGRKLVRKVIASFNMDEAQEIMIRLSGILDEKRVQKLVDAAIGASAAAPSTPASDVIVPMNITDI